LYRFGDAAGCVGLGETFSVSVNGRRNIDEWYISLRYGRGTQSLCSRFRLLESSAWKKSEEEFDETG